MDANPGVRIDALTFAVVDPSALAHFWGEALGWEVGSPAGRALDLVPTDGTAFTLRFELDPVEKRGQNRQHLDLTTSSEVEQAESVERLLAAGGVHRDVGQLPEERHVVLADPEGNELCLVEHDNGFLADCDRLGAISCDGTREVGVFWSEALGWPLIWDQDEETAIRAPGPVGPIISWGGPPLNPKAGARNRLRLDLVARSAGGHAAEVDRLLELGATHAPEGFGPPGAAALLDPDGNELCVLA